VEIHTRPGEGFGIDITLPLDDAAKQLQGATA
jgi:hypothetical protein